MNFHIFNQFEYNTLSSQIPKIYESLYRYVTSLKSDKPIYSSFENIILHSNRHFVENLKEYMSVIIRTKN